MKGLVSGIISTFLLLGPTVYASPISDNTPLLGAKPFKVLIKTPGDETLSGRHYMDMKDGVMGFGRGGELFKAHINGTEQGNSYLITSDDGFGFLLEDQAPRYVFRVDFNIPPTDFKAYWAVNEGVLTCHLLTNGFKYFPDPSGGYVIRWDTRDEEGLPLYMWVEPCRS